MFGKLLVLIIVIIDNRVLLFRKIGNFRFALKESFNNISIGIKLMLSNITGMLIIGIFRLFIVRFRAIDIFGQISFSLSISSFVLVFISAITLVFYPILKKISFCSQKKVYELGSNLFVQIAIIILAFYYPIKIILLYWLPRYEVAINLLGIIFPICIFSAHNQLFAYNYLQILRKETALLKLNFIVLLVACVLAFISVYLMKSLNIIVYFIVITIAVQWYLCDKYVIKLLHIKSIPNNKIEVLFVVLFVLLNVYIKHAGLIYLGAVLFYYFVRRKSLADIINQIKVVIH